jgi:hypothetical protein
VNGSPEEGSGQPRSTIPVTSWDRGCGNAGVAIAVLGLSSPEDIGVVSDSFGCVCSVLSGARGDSERRETARCRLAGWPSGKARAARKREQEPGGGWGCLEVIWPARRAGILVRRGCGRGAVVVVVVTARRVGTRSQKPCGARTRDIDTPAQPGDRRESERSERPGEQDCRARAQAERTRLMRCGGGYGEW